MPLPISLASPAASAVLASPLLLPSGEIDFSAFMPQKGASTPLFMQVALNFANAIHEKRLPPGTRIPSERDLARSLAVSRSTITDTFRELESRGLIRIHAGRGAFVCATSRPDVPFAWRGKISTQSSMMGEPILEQLMQSTPRAGSQTFTAGMPAIECFPKEEFQAALARVMQESAQPALGVGPTAGQMDLRNAVADYTKTDARRVMIVAGAQQGIDLIARCFIDPGDSVIMDRPGYPGGIQSMRAAGAVIRGWEAPEWDLRELEALFLRYRPKLLFTTPTFHNPTGGTMTLRRRIDLLELCARYRVPIVEDDIHRETWLDEPPPKSIYALDDQNLVISLNTFSKILAPGVRLGWLQASPYVIKQLSMIKMRSALFTEGMMQLVLADMLRSGVFQQHLGRLRVEHRRRRTVMQSALEKHMPAGLLRANQPAGGLYFWCEVALKSGMRTIDLYEDSDELPDFAPGSIFFPDDAGHAHVRLCFSAPVPSEIDLGVQRLARILTGQDHAQRRATA